MVDGPVDERMVAGDLGTHEGQETGGSGGGGDLSGEREKEDDQEGTRGKFDE